MKRTHSKVKDWLSFRRGEENVILNFSKLAAIPICANIFPKSLFLTFQSRLIEKRYVGLGEGRGIESTDAWEVLELTRKRPEWLSAEQKALTKVPSLG